MIKTSEQIDLISAALVKAQAKLQNVGKSGVAKGEKFSYKYVKLPEVLDEAREKLSAEGVYILQATVNGEGTSIGVITRLLHSSGQWIESALYCAPSKFDAQGVGSVSTYLRRYGLLSMIGMGAEDDDDGNAASVAAPQPQKSAGIYRAPDVPARPHVREAWGETEKPKANGNAISVASEMGVEQRAEIFRKEMQERFAKCKVPADVDVVVKNNSRALEGLKKVVPEVYADVMATATNAKNELFASA